MRSATKKNTISTFIKVTPGTNNILVTTTQSSPSHQNCPEEVVVNSIFEGHEEEVVNVRFILAWEPINNFLVLCRRNVVPIHPGFGNSSDL